MSFESLRPELNPEAAFAISAVSPRDEVLVALDLETTGLDPSSDRIIDIGAAKFRGDEEIESFRTLVNPRASLPPFIVSLTGITQAQVDNAPDWDEVMPSIEEFIRGHRIVGHNIRFDIRFLRSHGVQTAPNPYDTVEMAKVALPAGPEFGLERLSERFGIRHDDPHRALSDALASRDLFLILLSKFEAMPKQALLRMQSLGERSGWSVANLARNVAAAKSEDETGASFGHFGFDDDDLRKRIGTFERPSFTERTFETLTSSEAASFLSEVDDLFATVGALSKHLEGYEPRQGQRKMAVAVSRSLTSGKTLMAEAGTGIGKSLAYLLPAALHAGKNSGKIVISTNTINLQEQLLAKDFTTVRSIFKEEFGIDLKAAQLKGRSNYLCYRRWSDGMRQSTQSETDARVLSQCLTWLPDTDSGDRAELALGWDTPTFLRYSAEGCPPKVDGQRFYPCQGPPCFLLKARAEAMSADILIVNHSLLVTDMARGGGIIPDYDALIIDETHHLEAVATMQLGFQLRESALMDDLRELATNDGMMGRLVNLVMANSTGEHALSPVPGEQEKIARGVDASIRYGRTLFDAIRELTSFTTAREQTRELRVQGATRITREWRPVAEAWAEFAPPFRDLASGLRNLIELAGSSAEDDASFINASSVHENFSNAYDWLMQVIESPDPNFVYWTMVNTRRDQEVEVRGAPLDVSEYLREGLFSKPKSFVLTGATMTTHGDFERLAAKVGIDDWRELRLGSPFDFENSTLILVPEDMPEPGSPGYASAVVSAVHDIAVATSDRTLALFTANSALNHTRNELFNRLRNTNIKVFGQGRDGPPGRVLRLLNDEAKAVALGAMSLWEGIDLEDASIKSLVMTRLPFPVPSDPIHASRSELCDSPFYDYSIPEAVIRFRQGFGRLIRSQKDRGVFVVLDRRIISRRYGREFQQSIPKCTVRRVTLRTLPEHVSDWHSA